MPSETRENIIKFPPAVRQVYLTALALGSSKVSTKFACSKETWLSESLLGRNAFNRGLKICKRAGLLSYKRYIVTLNDPRTGKPSTRTTRERTEHTNTNWKFDLNTVKPTEWLVVVEDVLQRKFIFNGDDFWSVTQRGNWCPFCKTEKTFCINVNVAAYKCFNEKCPQPTGRLGQLVQRVLGSMAQAKARIQRTLKEAEEVEVTI